MGDTSHTDVVEDVGCADIPVVVIEDHPLFRRALVSELAAWAGLTVAGAYDSIEDFNNQHRRGSPETDARHACVALVDLNLPGVSGPEAVAHLRARNLTVLVVSAVDDPPVVLDAIAAGAAGYLTKGAEGQEIATAVRILAGGGTYISPTLASYLLTAASGAAVPGPATSDGAGHTAELTTLTERERAILGLVAAGETDRDIAEQMCISVSTVRTHLDRIRDKTGRRRRPDLTRLAFQAGLAGGDEKAASAGPEFRPSRGFGVG